MLTQIKNFLNQPYPDQDDLGSMVKGGIATALIVFLVLALFAPFGISETGSKIYFHAVCFGLISGVISIIAELFMKYVIKLQRDVPEWTFLRWILSVMFLILMIAIGNYFYAVKTFGLGNWGFMRMFYSTFVVGIFPIVFFGSYNVIRNLKANQLIAAELKYEDLPVIASANVSLPIKNSNKTFEINPAKILFLEAMQNYVLIHYLDGSDSIQKETHRNTISAIGAQLDGFGVKRAHRSYLVNPKMIKSITGNAQGLKLELEHCDEIVPVSRKYIKEFRS